MRILAWLVKLHILALQFITAGVPDLTPGCKMQEQRVAIS